MKVNKLTLSSPLFQNYLTHLADPPKQLFYTGELTGVEDRQKVAIVGSRKVSPYGRVVTEKIASELAKGGAVIISGLALGVDSMAHKATLQAGAVPVSEAGDVWRALGEEPAQQSTTFAENPEEAVVLQLLQAGVTDTAELLEKSQLDPSVFNQTLTMLEITGKIRSYGSGQWTL